MNQLFRLIEHLAVDQAHVVDNQSDGRVGAFQNECASSQRVMNPADRSRLADRAVERNSLTGRQIGCCCSGLKRRGVVAAGWNGQHHTDRKTQRYR